MSRRKCWRTSGRSFRSIIIEIRALTYRMDTLSVQQRSERMRRVKSRDTKPELVVRRMVHAMGFRYVIGSPGLPGRPDLVLPRLKKIIFVHGCFWHRHPASSCPLARLPKSKKSFWVPKLEGNRRRDLAAERKLRRLGWSILNVWECRITKVDALRHRLQGFLSKDQK
jgi:DNA mismatch endonuclease, patch repair protein